MGNISKKIKAIVIASAVSTLIALSASSTALATPDDNRPDYLQQECDGTLCYDVATGEVTFTAKQETKSSYAEEKSSPQYNPCADDDNNTVTPYMTDNRVKINNPQNDERCRNTVCIETTAPNGKVYTGTGFMIGPNAVATCGHLLCGDGYAADGYSWAWIDNAVVTPARNTGGNPKPYGSANGSKFICGLEWAKDYNYNYDWGIIVLDSNVNADVGWLGLRYQSGSYNGTDIKLNGYPENLGYYNMYMSSGDISKTETYQLYSDNAYSSDGENGGPCYTYYSDNGYTAIGLCIGKGGYGSPSYDETVFLRITSSVFDEFVAYRTSTL